MDSACTAFIFSIKIESCITPQDLSLQEDPAAGERHASHDRAPPLGVDGAVSSECSNESIEDCLDLRNYYVRLHSIALCIHCTLWELVARPRVLNQTNYVSGFHLIPVLCNGRWSIEGGPVSILGPS